MLRNNQKGSALVVSLLILILLSFIGIAGVMTSSRDMDISLNQKERNNAFYTAEAGLELAMGLAKNNGQIMANDSLSDLINGYSAALGYDTFKVAVTGVGQFKTLTSTGFASDGKAAVQVQVRRRRNPLNIWNNVMFAGTGQAGQGIQGNVSYHGSVHILGDGEPFTDANGNGKWDPDDTFTDTNGDGIWQPGEPLTDDVNGNGLWDPAEPYVDDNGSGSYDDPLLATELATDFSGTAKMYNNYSGMNGVLSGRIPSLDMTVFNGENVYTLDAELRVKHGYVSLDGTSTIGDADVSGGAPAIKETFDGTYVNDGYSGSGGTDNVYSDNGYSDVYDLGEELSFPSLNSPYYDASSGVTYNNYTDYLSSHAYVINGDVTLKPGQTYTGGGNGYGSISLDANGNLSITGMVYVTGNIHIDAGKGKYLVEPIVFDGRGTLASFGDTYINTHVLSKDKFPTEDVMGFLSNKNIYIGTEAGAAQLNLMGAFFAQNKIVNEKQNQIAGSMVSNYFDVKNVPDFFQVPSLTENLPPGMPGGATIYIFTYKKLAGTWRELY